MAAPNEVRFKVRHYALLLEEFTVSQIVELTGLESPSVRTEIQRMRSDGFVTALHQKAQGRGRPPCLYRLTDDPEARLALSRSIEGFYIETTPRSIEASGPSSRHFFEAVQLIQDLFRKGMEDSELDAAIEEAAYHLEFARCEEGVGREGTEVIGAFLNKEMAKLEAVRRNFAEAERLFRQSIATFQDAALHDEVERVHRDWLCVLIKQQIEIARMDRTLDWLRTVELLQDSLSKACKGDFEECSLARLLKDLFDLIVEKGRTQQPEYLALDDAKAVIRQTAQEAAHEAAHEATQQMSEAFESDLYQVVSGLYSLLATQSPSASHSPSEEHPYRKSETKRGPGFEQDWMREKQ